jgi:hypothetical protein
MEPRKVGRTLGIGVRVASNMVRQKVEESRQNAQALNPGTSNEVRTPPRPVTVAREAASRAGNVRRGFRAFTHSLVTPFTHAGSILWLEITGLFFALFALFFGQNLYRMRGLWNQPVEERHLLMYAALTLVFAWFSVSSFVRARQKTRQGPARK